MFRAILLLATITSCNAIGYSNQLALGSNHYTVSVDHTNGAYSVMKDTSLVTQVASARIAIQIALNSIYTDGGGIVYLPDALYILDYQINIFSKTNLQGAGIDKTILKMIDNCRQFDYAGLVRGYINATDIKISDLTIDGNKYNQLPGINYGRYGVYTETVTNIWIDHVRVTNFEEYGFDPHGKKWQNQDGSWTGMWGTYLTITNCISDHNDRDGFTLDMNNYVHVENCLSQYNGRHGYNIVTGTGTAKIFKSISQYNGVLESSACGITAQNNLLLGTNNIIITDNIITHSNSNSSGICITDVTRITIRNNKISNYNYCTCRTL